MMNKKKQNISQRDLGARIHALREAAGMTATAFAAAANLALPTVSAIEAGAVGLGPARLARIAVALGMPIERLLAEVPPHLDPEVARLLGPGSVTIRIEDLTDEFALGRGGSR